MSDDEYAEEGHAVLCQRADCPDLETHNSRPNFRMLATESEWLRDA